MNRRLAAGGSFKAIEAAPGAKPAGGRRADEKPADQVIIHCAIFASTHVVDLINGSLETLIDRLCCL